MYAPSFSFAAFNGLRDWHLSAKIMTLALDFLTEVDVAWFLADPTLPDLYRSGVQYYADRFWEGPWLDAKTVARLSFADCKSLATYRCAELRVRQGVMAVPEFSRALLADGTQWFHIIVRLPNGNFEDPSRVLGMK